MSILVGGYVGAKRCVGQALPGTKALMAWYLAAYGGAGAANLGTYVCKDIKGSGTTSLHGEGRAADLGSKPYRTLPFMDDVADALVANSKELGVQCVIHDNRIWSASYPYAGWRVYHGADDHAGHLHVELTPQAGQTLTVARINQVVTGQPVPRPQPVPTPSHPVSDWTRSLIMALPEMKAGRGLNGTPDEDVQSMQNLLQARGHRRNIDATGGADGRWGSSTTADLRSFQRASGIDDDGICGRVTWAYLLRQPKAAK